MILQNSSNLHRTVPSDVNDILDREKGPIILSTVSLLLLLGYD